MVAARRFVSGCRAESSSCLKGQLLSGDGSPTHGACPSTSALSVWAKCFLTPRVTLLGGCFVELAVLVFTTLADCSNGLRQGVE